MLSDEEKRIDDLDQRQPTLTRDNRPWPETTDLDQWQPKN